MVAPHLLPKELCLTLRLGALMGRAYTFLLFVHPPDTLC